VNLRISQRWDQYFSRWLNKRVPPKEKLQLNLRSVFIFPSRFGWAYLLMLNTLFLLGTNYQNNLILALAYLLASLFVTTIFHSFFNLSALKVEGLSCEPLFLGESARFELLLKVDGHHHSHRRFNFLLSGVKERYEIYLDAKNGSTQGISSFDRDARLGADFTPLKRGWFKVERLRLFSRYPLGIFTCWALLSMKQKALVYPKPVICSISLCAGGQSVEGDSETAIKAGEQEFIGIRPYREGEAINQIAWKQVAQGRGWVSKEFTQPEMSRSWLNLSETKGESLEQRLGKLCYQVIELSRTGVAFGLDLGRLKYSPSLGKQHKLDCLKALALYE